MNDDVKIIRKNIDITGLRSEIKYIFEKYHKMLIMNQVSLQSNDPNVTPETGWNCSIGRWENIKGIEKDYIYPVFPDAKLLNHYLKTFKMTRSRIMMSKPKECMYIHTDMSPRIHIPLWSSEKCLMVIDRTAYYLEPGNIYWTDTTKPHTAMNGSSDVRMHIIGCVTE